MNGLSRAYLIGVVKSIEADGVPVNITLDITTTHRSGDGWEEGHNVLIVVARGRERNFLQEHARPGSKLAVECNVESKGGMVALVVEKVLWFSQGNEEVKS